MIIKWTNKFSGESGYVKSISVKGKHFNNTYNKDEARVFTSKGRLTAALNQLKSFGETQNNDFTVETLG